MKIFVSYSRTDAGNFAEKIRKDLTKKGHDVFIDKDSIKIGTKWSKSIEENISNCDIFVVIVTPNASESEFIKGEVLQAQNENKRIIPCYYKDFDEYPEWNLNDYQGIEFKDEYSLALNLYKRLEGYSQNQKNGTGPVNLRHLGPDTKAKGSFPPSMQRKSINYIVTISLILLAVVFVFLYVIQPSPVYVLIFITYFALSIWTIIRANQISYVVSLFVTLLVTLILIFMTNYVGSGNIASAGNLPWVIMSFITICILTAGLFKLKRF